MDDKTDRGSTEAGRRLLTTQNRVLELIATRRPFQEILVNICFLIENLSEGAWCTILLLDKDKRRLRAGASGRPEYLEALDGLYLGREAGSCAAAALLGRAVITEDVETDPTWRNCQSVARQLDIRACWSTPFFSSTGNVLGTFAITHDHPCSPSPYQEQLLETASYLAGIATENHLFEEELIKSQKLEAIALLAGGIAHDFNNMLTAIMGNISLARSPGRSAQEVARMLAAAEDASLRARDVTQQLLTFARGGAPLTSTESVGDIIRETADFILSGSNVRCEVTGEAVKHAEIDRGQVSQVIQNVLLNALQAMPTGGVIKIHEEIIHHSGDELPNIEPGEYVRVAISDQGIGILPEHLQRVFDPYFSTKDNARGLGLATSYSIMKKHGGWIDLSSRVGAGTTFYLYFPVADIQPRTGSSETRQGARFDGTILIMDDDDAVREVLGEMFSTLGYGVLFARNGEEVVELFAEQREAGHTPDLVVLDLTVPGAMGGVETLRELRKIDSGVKAVATSGYANDPVLANQGVHGFVGRLEKPYRIADVKALLESVMTDDVKARARGARLG